MTGSGIVLCDLAPSGCQECGRPLGNRWLTGAPSGCGTCDEGITRHRCTGLPDIFSLGAGESWECPGCGSAWTAVDEEAACSECGGPRIARTWSYAEGPRIADAPRHEPAVFTPFRDAVPAAASGCYRTPGGSMVHVKPGCRCATVR